MQKTPVWFLGWEELLKEGMATHSSILPGESPWGCRESGKTEWLNTAQHIPCTAARVIILNYIINHFTYWSPFQLLSASRMKLIPFFGQQWPQSASSIVLCHSHTHTHTHTHSPFQTHQTTSHSQVHPYLLYHYVFPCVFSSPWKPFSPVSTWSTTSIHQEYTKD